MRAPRIARNKLVGSISSRALCAPSRVRSHFAAMFLEVGQSLFARSSGSIGIHSTVELSEPFNVLMYRPII